MKKFLMISIMIFVQGAWGQASSEGGIDDTSTNNSASQSPAAPQNSDSSSNNSSSDSTAQTVGNVANSIADSSKNPPVQVVPPIKYVSPAGGISNGQLGTEINSCNSAASQAQTICIANSNPSVQTAVSLVSKLVAAGTAGLSVADSCSKFNDALKIANDAVTAYNAACAAMQYRCVSSCSKLNQDYNTSRTSIAKELSRNVGNPVTQSIATLDQQDLSSTGDFQTALAATQKACGSYKKNMMDAGIGLAGMVTGSMLASTCQNKTTDTASTKCSATTNNLCINGVDCSQAANATNPTCICNSNPNAPGCPGATTYGSSYSSPSYGATGTTSSGTTSTASGSNGNGSLSAVTRNAAPTTSADGSSAGSGGGGGMGGALSGDSIAASADKKGQTADKKGTLNPNILSDYDGGGGGGRGGYGGGGSGESNYRAYMPGQKKDPSRALASQNGASSQVTSAGSKSNWEKITERYTENKPTLMGD